MNDLDKIIDFCKKYLRYENIEQLKEIIKKHAEYNTYDYAVDDNGNIVSFVRYNLNDDCTVAIILDLAIAPEWRNRNIGMDLIVRNLKRWPKVKRLEFKRGYRDPFKEHHLNLDRLFRMKKGV